MKTRSIGVAQLPRVVVFDIRAVIRLQVHGTDREVLCGWVSLPVRRQAGLLPREPMGAVATLL